jgi:hypothetical protein
VNFLGLNDNIDHDNINDDYLINGTVDHDYSVLTPGYIGIGILSRWRLQLML